MNKTDRMLAIVLELQGKGRQRAEDLATTFETSKRTIYRDMLALGEAGVPVVSIPGLGYSLMEGYFLPPLHFTTEEAIILLLGSGFMAQNFDSLYQVAARSASSKIANVLPDKQRREVHLLQEGIQFIGTNPVGPELEEKLLPLRRAILERITVSFLYHTRHPEEDSPSNRRSVNPYGLIHLNNVWHLTAYCHLRQSIRFFRLDRMDQLELLDQHFERPPDYAMQPRRTSREGPIQVRVLFDRIVERWVRESPSFFTIAQEETSDGLLVTLRIRREEEIIQWLLGWGSHFKVLEPASLRQRLREEAQAMACNHQE